MTIYTGNDYRKIYESHHGTIPKDEDGRTYEIHHIDGDHENNAIENLQCVSIQEHYDIHHSQEDWGACLKITLRMSLTPEGLSTLVSALARKTNLKRVEAGIHPFLKRADGNSVGKETALKRVKAGTNPFQTRADGSSVSSDRVKARTHNFLTRADGRTCLFSEKKHPQYDHTVYSFIHTSGITEDCTQNELRMKYDLNQGNLSVMVRSDGAKSVKGWRIIQFR